MAKRRYRGYVKLENELLDSPAWRSLKSVDRDLFIHMKSRCRPANNGYLGFGVREAAALIGCKPDTAMGAFERLQDRRLIVLTRESNWQQRKAREWRLTTDVWNDRQPTNDWRNWVLDEN